MHGFLNEIIKLAAEWRDWEILGLGDWEIDRHCEARSNLCFEYRGTGFRKRCCYH